MVRGRLIKLPQVLFNRRPLFIYIFQTTLVATSLVLAWLLRFDFSLPYRRVLLTSGPLLVVIRLITLRVFKLNHGWWHFASVSDALNILKAVTVGSACFFILDRFLFGAVSFPRSVYVLEAVLTGCFLAGARLASRVLVESVRHDSSSRLRRVMLVGAGFAAEMVIRELARPESGYLAVGCLMMTKQKRASASTVCPFLAPSRSLKRLSKRHSVDEILIAIPSASGKQMRRITEACQKTNLPFKTVPTLSDIIRGEASVKQFREVRLDDLLGREACSD